MEKIKKISALLLALSIALTLSLTGCAKKGGRVVNVCGWGENIDPALITAFEKETGITVNYSTAESNETMYAVIKQGGADYDVIVPSDYMIAQMIAEDMLAELNFGSIPNFSLIDSQYKNLPYDPENRYSVPYTWGTLGIIYNSAIVEEEIDSWGVLFNGSSKYAGSIGMIGNPRDAIGAALLYLGYSVNTTNEEEIQEAYQVLSSVKSKNIYQGFYMDQLYDKMESGETAICTYYAGDFLSMYMNNSDLRFVVPKEGGNWFVDAMCVLKDAEHKEEAEAWINFLCKTESCLANMDFIWYASPNAEALAQYPDYYEEQNGEPLDPMLYEVMAAPADVLARCESYNALPAETQALYSDLWIQLGIE